MTWVYSNLECNNPNQILKLSQKNERNLNAVHLNSSIVISCIIT